MKATDIWQDDQRGWWLRNLLRGAVLRAKNTITVDDLLVGSEQVVVVSPFSIADALHKGNLRQVLQLLEQVEEADTDYFLWAIWSFELAN